MIVVKVAVTIQVTANSTVSIHAVHLYQVGGVDGIGGRAIPRMISHNYYGFIQRGADKK